MRYWPLYVLIVTIAITSCSDIFEEDISTETVVLLSPHNNIETTLSTQTFWWDYVADADFYQLQVVMPDFNETERLMLDTLLSKNQFIFNLSPNSYEWRVRALNSGYSTDYTSYNLTIDSTLDLSNELVILRTPIQYDTTNLISPYYSWNKLYNADEYNLRVMFDGSPIIDTIMSNNSITILLEDGQGAYSWSVKAINEFSQTAYNQREYFLDLSIPLPRTLFSPLDQSVIQDSIVQCVWNSPPIVGSSEYDSLYIYRDQSMTNIVLLAKVENEQFDVELDNGWYFWRVRGIDKAGNRGDYSVLWSFEIISK
ncbi:MAG: hypothetical protein QM503_03145 [Bacteroidota bacterium]